MLKFGGISPGFMIFYCVCDYCCGDGRLMVCAWLVLVECARDVDSQLIREDGLFGSHRSEAALPSPSPPFSRDGATLLTSSLTRSELTALAQSAVTSALFPRRTWAILQSDQRHAAPTCGRWSPYLRTRWAVIRPQSIALSSVVLHCKPHTERQEVTLIGLKRIRQALFWVFFFNRRGQ